VAGAGENRFAGSRLESRFRDTRPDIRPGSWGKKRQKRARLAEGLERVEDLGRRGIAAGDVSCGRSSKAFEKYSCGAQSVINFLRPPGSHVALTLGKDMDCRNWRRRRNFGWFVGLHWHPPCPCTTQRPSAVPRSPLLWRERARRCWRKVRGRHVGGEKDGQVVQRRQEQRAHREKQR
jgi:hypothetical protein